MAINEKGSKIIQGLLSSRLWKVIYTHHREYQIMGLETFSVTYCLSLERMLEKFNYTYGLDANDQETDFKKYWIAVQEKDKNNQITELTKRVRRIKHDNAQSKHDVLNHLTEAPNSGNCPYYIKQFFQDFEKKKPNWDFSSQEGINQFKKSYLSALDKSYMWGKIDNNVISEYWRHTKPIVSQIRNQSKLMRSQAQQGISNQEPPANPQLIVSQPDVSGNLSSQQPGGNTSHFGQNQPQTTNHIETPGRNLFNQRVEQDPTINVHPPLQNQSINPGIFYKKTNLQSNISKPVMEWGI